MIEWIRRRWQRITTHPCPECGAAIDVSAYRPTGETHKGTWWAAGGAQLECPACGYRFWVKR